MPAGHCCEANAQSCVSSLSSLLPDIWPIRFHRNLQQGRRSKAMMVKAKLLQKTLTAKNTELSVVLVPEFFDW